MSRCIRERCEDLNQKGLKKREIVADFSGCIITSDAGGMLLRQVDYGFDIAEKVAVAFTDKRDQRFDIIPCTWASGSWSSCGV